MEAHISIFINTLSEVLTSFALSLSSFCSLEAAARRLVKQLCPSLRRRQEGSLLLCGMKILR